jgi:Protein of unknown function (DUF1656)
MKFTEIDVFGVYVAPMALMLIAAWFVAIALRWVAARFGLLRYIPRTRLTPNNAASAPGFVPSPGAARTG